MQEPVTPPPVVGEWYRDIHDDTFEVVAVDEQDGTVEVQHFDGTLEEWDLADWLQSPLRAAEPPEDWSGSMDIEREDYGVDLEDIRAEEWASPLDYFDRAE